MAAIDEKEYTKSFDLKIWKRLLPFLARYRKAFALMLVFNLLTAIIDIAVPLFQRYAISQFIETRSLTGIVPFTIVYLLVILAQALSVVAFGQNSWSLR